MLPHQKATYLKFLELNSPEEIAKNFGLGNTVKNTKNNSVWDTSFSLETEKGTYQVTIYSKSEKDPEHFAPLVLREIAYVKFLEQKRLIVPHHLSFQPFIYNGKLAAVSTILSKEKLSNAIQTDDTMINVGAFVATMHKVALEFGDRGMNLEQRNSFRDSVDENLNQIVKLLDLPAHSFIDLLNKYQELRKNRAETDPTLPCALTHGEITYVNIVETPNGLGLTNFEGLKFTPLIFDFGQTLITMTYDGTAIHQHLISAFLRGYEAIRPLTQAEKLLIPHELIYNYLHKLEWRMTAMLNMPNYVEPVKLSLNQAPSFIEQANRLTL